MGITSSCKPNCSCGRNLDGQGESRVRPSRQHYDFPAGATDAGVAFAEEPVDAELWEAKGQLAKVGGSGDIGQAALGKGTGGKDEIISPDNGQDGYEKSHLKDSQDSGISNTTTNADGTPSASANLTPSNLDVSVSPDRKHESDQAIAPQENGYAVDDDRQPTRQESTQEETEDALEAKRNMSLKQAVKKAMLANNIGAKVAMDNKIGKKLEGWFRDVALELQQGIAAEGRGITIENFEAPEESLFLRSRVACGFPPARYFATMGLQDGLTEPNLALIGGGDAAGKSGSFFFLSPDQQLIAKSATDEDWTTLLRILPAYVEFIEAARARADEKSAQRHSQDKLGTVDAVRGFTETLLPRFLGLYSLHLGGDKHPVRVLVMANVFGGAMSIDRRYDLKGSTHGRKASKKECAKKAPTYKDIDWMAKEPGIEMSASNRSQLISAIDLDVAFLAKHGLMDYSLLVGVHDVAADQPRIYEAMNVVTVRDSTRHCYLGIIDVLTPYVMRKRAETFFLGKVFCGRDISCQHPRVYARRFFRFVDNQVFLTA